MTSRFNRFRSIAALVPAWTVREVRAQYRQSALDLGWSLLTPVITLVGYGVVLTRAFGVDGDGVPYIAFAWAGLVTWNFLASSLQKGSMSLVASSDLVRKVSFPHEVVPIAGVFANGLDLLIGLAGLGVLMVIQDVSLRWSAIAVFPVIVVMFVWAIAFSILVATLTAFVRDLHHGLVVMLRIGIFVTPVMYPPSQVPPAWDWALAANPAAVFIDAIRASLLRGEWPAWGLVGAHTAIAVAVLVLATWYSARVSGRLADVI